jgi:hypothetical protein
MLHVVASHGDSFKFQTDDTTLLVIRMFADVSGLANDWLSAGRYIFAAPIDKRIGVNGWPLSLRHRPRRPCPGEYDGVKAPRPHLDYPEIERVALFVP